MKYLITGGPDDGKDFDISFNKCEEKQFEKFHHTNTNSTHPSSRQQKLIDAHLESDSFWCPEAFDLSFWGMRGDFDAK